MPKVRWIMTVFAVWLACVWGVVWASAAWRYQRGTTVLVPVVIGEVRVEVWPVVMLADRFSPYGYSMFSSEPTNARWVGVWYQNRATGTTLRLAAFTPPTWPITALAVVTVMITIWLWLDKRQKLIDEIFIRKYNLHL